MKKFILSTSILAVLFSCKKNETADQLETKETPTVILDSTIATPTGNLSEITQQQLTALLAPKQNDTIYVTNFFATWCGPCMKEIPHFKEKMTELNGKAVKFTFVSVDAKEEWNMAVKDFAKENELEKHIVLFDASNISPKYFMMLTKTWDGGSIPFTVIKKGDKSDETVGMMSKEMLDAKLNSFK